MATNWAEQYSDSLAYVDDSGVLKHSVVDRREECYRTLIGIATIGPFASYPSCKWSWDMLVYVGVGRLAEWGIPWGSFFEVITHDGVVLWSDVTVLGFQCSCK